MVITTYTIDTLLITLASFVRKFIGGFCTDFLGPKNSIVSGLLSITTLCFLNSPYIILEGCVF